MAELKYIFVQNDNIKVNYFTKYVIKNNAILIMRNKYFKS